MKRRMPRLLAILWIAVLLTGCSAAGNITDNTAGIIPGHRAGNIAGNRTSNRVALTLDMRGNYTAFTGLPKDCTMKEAEAAGDLVLHNNEVAAGQKVWDQFMDTAAQGGDAGIRMAHFFDDEADSPFYYDLFYQSGTYYLFDNTAEIQKPQPFAYLLNLTGQTGNPLKDATFIVLTNDNNLMFADVWRSMISSDTAVINSIAPHRIVRMISE